MACNPLPHSRFTVSAAASTGMPPRTAATRARYMSFLFGVDDIAEYNMADLVRRKARALHTLADNFRCELSSAERLQCSPEFNRWLCAPRSGRRLLDLSWAGFLP